MKLRLPSIIHPKIGCKVIFDNRLNLRELLKDLGPKGWLDTDRDYCDYCYSLNKEDWYWGSGRYWDLMKYSIKKWMKSRPFKKQKNHLAHSTINEDWEIRIFAMGLTKNQSKALEAYCIREANKTKKLSKNGQYIWDGVSLMNKHREWEAEKMIDKYLNLDGNNYWEVISRTPDYY